jgi:hypothetical protein
MAPLNWEKLVPYDRNQYRSFEELCYQIATVHYETGGGSHRLMIPEAEMVSSSI